LEKARSIQWDYKNIVKRKGVLLPLTIWSELVCLISAQKFKRSVALRIMENDICRIKPAIVRNRIFSIVF
jgi:hypothetical protein